MTVNYEQSRYITRHRISPARCKTNIVDWLYSVQGYTAEAARQTVQEFHDMRGDLALKALWAGIMADQVTAADVMADLQEGRISREEVLNCEKRWAQPIDTHFITIDFGSHKDQPFTRVPIGYLRWMFNSDHTQREEALAEIERRGYDAVPKYELEISGHALDRASQPPIVHMWEASRFSDDGTDSGAYEGLHHWLMRMAWEALERIEQLDKAGEYERTHVAWMGIKFSFAGDVTYWPVLKTVIPECGGDEWTGVPDLAAPVVSEVSQGG